MEAALQKYASSKLTLMQVFIKAVNYYADLELMRIPNEEQFNHNEFAFTNLDNEKKEFQFKYKDQSSDGKTTVLIKGMMDLKGANNIAYVEYTNSPKLLYFFVIKDYFVTQPQNVTFYRYESGEEVAGVLNMALYSNADMMRTEIIPTIFRTFNMDSPI